MVYACQLWTICSLISKCMHQLYDSIWCRIGINTCHRHFWSNNICLVKNRRVFSVRSGAFACATESLAPIHRGWSWNEIKICPFVRLYGLKFIVCLCFPLRCVSCGFLFCGRDIPCALLGFVVATECWVPYASSNANNLPLQTLLASLLARTGWDTVLTFRWHLSSWNANEGKRWSPYPEPHPYRQLLCNGFPSASFLNVIVDHTNCVRW